MENALAALSKSAALLRRVVLENGMVCLIKEDRSAPVAAVQIWVGTGSIHEQEYLGGGLSHYVEHMIFKGTPSRPIGEITRQINNAGGSINAYTGHDRTVFHTELPAKAWQVGVDVLADALMNASFPETEWEKEKNVILRECAMGRDDPHSVLSKALWRTAYTVHPYRFPVIGHEDVFRTMTRDDLIAFFKRNYVPDNMITVVVGDVDPAAVEAHLRKTFEKFSRRARPPVVLPVEPPQIAPRVVRETGAYNLSRLGWAYHSVALSDPDCPAMDLLASIAGQGQSSRLVREVREKAKLVHSIEAWSYTPKEPGLFGISATFDPDKESAVVAAIQSELDRWATQGFAVDEIEKARRQILTSMLSGIQTMSGQAGDFASGQFYAGDPAFSQIYFQRLSEVTPQSLQTVVRRYLRPENMTRIVLAPTSAPPAEVREAAIMPSDVQSAVVSPPGVRVLTREDRRLPFVNIVAVMGGGVLSETEANAGITHLLSEMLIRGTSRRSAADIAQMVESRGGSLSVFSGLNSFGIQARCLSGDAPFFMNLVGECLTDAAFAPDEIERQKELQIAAIAEQRDRPFYIAQEMLRGAIFAGHPYRWDSLGNAPAVKAVRRDDLLRHYRRHVVAGNMVISVFGDIAPDAARRLVEKGLSRLPRDEAPAYEHGEPAPALPARIVRRLPREQSIVLTGFLGVGMQDPRRDPLHVLQTALSGLSSELGTEIREKRGLAYYAGAYQRTDVGTGSFVLYAGTREPAVPEVEVLMAEQVKRITTQGIREEEVQRAKNQIVAHYDMSLQDNMDIAMNCALNELLGLGYGHHLRTRERMEAVTPDQIRDAAASVMLTNRMAVAIILPEKPVSP